MSLTDSTLKQIAIISENLKDNIFKYTSMTIEYGTYAIWLTTYVNGTKQSQCIDSLYIPVFEALCNAANIPMDSCDIRDPWQTAVR